jgi:hypothetical protein
MINAAVTVTTYITIQSGMLAFITAGVVRPAAFAVIPGVLE